jgi:hypothetical protein
MDICIFNAEKIYYNDSQKKRERRQSIGQNISLLAS